MTYSVKQLAERWRCDAHKVLRFIASGELTAVNLSEGASRPRWIITDEAIREFEAARSSSGPTKITRRKRQSEPAGYIHYFR